MKHAQIIQLAKCLLLFGFLFNVNEVFAHPPGLSSVDIAIKPEHVLTKLTFSVQDIEAFVPMDSDLDAEVSDGERNAAKPFIAKFLAEQISIDIDGRQLKPELPGRVDYDEQNNTHIEFQFTATPQQRLTFQSRFLTLLPDGHQQFVKIIGVEGNALQEKVLSKLDDQLQLEFSLIDGKAQAQSQTWLPAFFDFFKLGLEHIVTGYDHLLFLFALLAVTHSFWPAIKIITFFTIAHSVTLAIAGMNLLELPSNVVEPFIAASIVYVAVENLIRGDHPKGRHWLTFCFGLVHGFGFASVLQEMNISSGNTGILLPLLSFNLGIEIGQIAVAALVLPIIWWLNSRPEFASKFLKAFSLMISVVGGYWFLERTIL
jgi:hydrogenase/urease accessory protein HupE